MSSGNSQLDLRRRQGLGFAQGDDWSGDYGGDYFFDDYGNYWEYDWFDNNVNSGGGYDLPLYDTPDWTGFGPSPSPSANDYRYDFDWGQYLSDWLSGNVETINTFAQAPGQQPSYRDITGSLDYRDSIWDWLTNLGPGPASRDSQYGPAGDGSTLPGYCPKGTYHPVNDPYACVPFPADNNAAKKQAAQQKKAQQSAANALKAAQKKQDQSCPKHPQGLPVWKNPATGKCEVVPQCPQGSKFDSTAKRCLTAAQAKELYGDNSWLWWLLIGGGALLLVTKNNSGGRRR